MQIIYTSQNWVADTYDKKHYDANIAQKWRVVVDKNRNFIITNHKAWMFNPKYAIENAN